MKKQFKKIHVVAIVLLAIGGIALSSARLEAQSLNNQSLINAWEVFDKIEMISPEVLDHVNLVALEQELHQLINNLHRYSDWDDLFLDLELIPIREISGGRGSPGGPWVGDKESYGSGLDFQKAAGRYLVRNDNDGGTETPGGPWVGDKKSYGSGLDFQKAAGRYLVRNDNDG
ncbi:MAG: hypothetical protein KJ645_01995, partial [Planctomycetes bacterium]|nr:hypothetical protein [Planctomycetota bacterium]